MSQIRLTIEEALKMTPDCLVIVLDPDEKTRSRTSDLDFVAIPLGPTKTSSPFEHLTVLCETLRGAQSHLNMQGAPTVSFFSFNVQELMRGIGALSIGSSAYVEAIHALFFISTESFLEIESPVIAEFFLTRGRPINGSHVDVDSLLEKLKDLKPITAFKRECHFRITEAFVNWKSNAIVPERILKDSALRNLKQVCLTCFSKTSPRSPDSLLKSWSEHIADEIVDSGPAQSLAEDLRGLTFEQDVSDDELMSAFTRTYDLVNQTLERDTQT